MQTANSIAGLLDLMLVVAAIAGFGFLIGRRKGKR